MGVKIDSSIHKNAEVKIMNQLQIIKISYGNQEINMVPIYLNGSFWERDFAKLNNQLESLNLKNLMIVGDLNARIGLENAIDDDMCSLPDTLKYNRKSKDDYIDQKGKKLLEMLDNYNCIVLNRRSRGDRYSWRNDIQWRNGVIRN